MGASVWFGAWGREKPTGPSGPGSGIARPRFAPKSPRPTTRHKTRGTETTFQRGIGKDGAEGTATARTGKELGNSPSEHPGDGAMLRSPFLAGLSAGKTSSPCPTRGSEHYICHWIFEPAGNKDPAPGCRGWILLPLKLLAKLPLTSVPPILRLPFLFGHFLPIELPGADWIAACLAA